MDETKKLSVFFIKEMRKSKVYSISDDDFKQLVS